MNLLYAFFLCVALAAIQLPVAGTRLLFALPAYALLAVIALLSLVDLRRSKLAPNGWCLVSSAVLFGYVLIRALFSPVVYLAWEDGFMVLGALIVYLLTACYLTDPRRRLWIFGWLLVLAAADLAIGVRQFAGDDKTTAFGFLRSVQYAGRASGFFVCPDHLAGFLEMVICLGVSVVVWSRVKPWVRVLCGYTTICCLAGLLLTGSRGGYLSTAVGLLVFIILALQRVRIASPEWFGRAVVMVLVVALLAGGGISLALTRSPLLNGRTAQLVDTRDIRLKIWPSAWLEFQTAPVLGTGSGTFLYYGRRFRDPSVQADPIHTHNDYLQFLGEYGAVGAVALLFFLGAHLGFGFQVFRRWCRCSAGQGGGGGSNAVAWNIGALAATACLLAHSAVDFNLHIPANTLVLAFIFGVLTNPGRPLDSAGEQMARFRVVDLLPRLTLPLLALVILIWGMPMLSGEYYAERARVALRDGHDAAALGFALHGTDRKSNNPYLYGYLGQARLKLGGAGPDTLFARSFRTAAAEAFSEALQLAPDDTTLLARLGEAQSRLNDFTAAEKTFRQARFWDPNSAWVLTYEGVYLQQRGLYGQAAAAFTRAAELDGNSAAVNNLQQLIERIGPSSVPASGTRGNDDPNADSRESRP